MSLQKEALLPETYSSPARIPSVPTAGAPTGGTTSVRQTGPIGRLLADRFRIDRLVGNGGMAAVYQATDVVLGRPVAVKLFRVDSSGANGPERQSGEVAVLASLNHFALVTLYDAGTTVIDGVPRTFIVMEFVDGPDLQTRISQGPLPVTEVAEIGADLAEALHYVHSRGIIHRDIKPGNVLLAPSEFPGRSTHAKLADFGIARLVDSTRLTATGALIGTASYLSPEQALGSALGPPTDVYSLGLVLLECLTGERAYPGTAVESAMARLQRQPEIPGSLAEDWHRVLGGMTSREPADRLLPEEAALALRRLAEAGAVADAVADAGGDADAVTVAMAAAGATASTAALVDDRTAATALLPVGTTLDDETGVQAVGDTRGNTVSDARGNTGANANTSAQPDVAAASVGNAQLRSKRNLVLLGVVAVLVAAIIALFFAFKPAEPAGTPPSYPAVEGTLGTHLQQLQKSVEP